MIITIDGPSGTGKTTVAKNVAERLHFPYFDTGAMYRGVTWLLLEKGIPFTDLDTMQLLLDQFSFRIDGEGPEKRYFVDGTEVTKQIRSQKVTLAVSAVSAQPIVREALWRIQKRFGAQGNAVFEGRDMGSVVFPEAEVKVFLTARPEIRARRRLAEILEKHPLDAANMDYDKMLADIMRRDTYDSNRELAPLKCPEGACQIDTSDLTIDAVVELVLAYAKEKL